MWEGKTSSFSFVVIWFILDIFSHTFDRFTNLTNIKLNQYSFEFLNKSHLFLFYHCQTLIVKLSLLGEGVRCFGSVWNPVLFLDEVIFREQGELFRLAIQFNHHPTSFGHLYPVLLKKKVSHQLTKNKRGHESFILQWGSKLPLRFCGIWFCSPSWRQTTVSVWECKPHSNSPSSFSHLLSRWYQITDPLLPAVLSTCSSGCHKTGHGAFLHGRGQDVIGVGN